MINSHKELVESVLNFGEKMDMIQHTEYNTDINKASERVLTMPSRGFLFSVTSFAFDEDYNSVITYGFTIIDKTNDTVEEVANAESENMFCVSALHDYLNRANDGEMNLNNLEMNSSGNEMGVLTSISGFFTLNVKRSASYWKKLEEFDA